MNSFAEKICNIYKSYGYSQYKMSKFEEYELYVRNKDFLVSDNIITFTDLSGKLMALKPDVTLSIIKNSDDVMGSVSKVYYNENVYRVAKGDRSFKEIKQVGLECFGDVDDFCIYEVLSLAIKTLKSISNEYKLDVSNISIITEILDGIDIDTKCRNEILQCFGQKNIHEMERVCSKYGVPSKATNTLIELNKTYGSASIVIPKLKSLLPNNSGVLVLEKILNELDDENVLVDFSVVNDIHYYNGIVFNGFINGIADNVLAGGQYDNLLARLKRKSKAIGFALYLNMLEDFFYVEPEYDVDVVIVYSDSTDINKLQKKSDELRSLGKTVLVLKNTPDNIRAKEVISFA